MDILFLVAGLVLLSKKQVKISSQRVLRGKPVKILAVLYILPFVCGFIYGLVARAVKADPFKYGPFVSIGMIVVAIIVTIYFIVVTKHHAGKETEEIAAPADFLHLKIWLPAILSLVVYGYVSKYLGRSLLFEPATPWFLVWLALQLIATYYTHRLLLRRNRSGLFIFLPLVIGILGTIIVYFIPAKKVGTTEINAEDSAEKEKLNNKLFHR